MMRDRLLQVKRLLAPNGSVWVPELTGLGPPNPMSQQR